MNIRVWLIGCAALTVTACEEFQSAGFSPAGGGVGPAPEAVVALADPRQDLTTVKLDPADGCYVYRYVGPVETTFLPVRTPTGSPICVASEVTPVPG
jgi:hypothetical protein